MNASADERRTARLLFAPEIAAGTLADTDLDHPLILSVARSRPIPRPPVRIAQLVAQRSGRLTHDDAIGAALAARHGVLGEAAAGLPRVLVRVDEFPHYRAWDEPERFGTEDFARFASIMSSAGVPYLLATVPRVPRAPLDPDATAWRGHDEAEAATLAALATDPDVTFGVHGLDHRSRRRDPRRHSELAGLDRRALDERLDAADAALAAAHLPTDVLVAPYNRFERRQYPWLAERYAVITGGPESVGALGWQPTPQVRDGAVYLPAYRPLYGRAGEVLAGIEALVERRAAVWAPVVLHWGWERDDGWDALERLASALAGVAVRWEQLRDAAGGAQARVRDRGA